MTLATNTELTVRVQARGGMFLGPDSFNGAIVTITKAGSQLAGPALTNQGNSGTREPVYTAAASPFPIITPAPPGHAPTVNWVVASATTVKCTTKFNLTVPTLLKVEVRVPLPPEQGDQYAAAEVWVIPRPQPSSVPGLVIEIPGLWVQPELVVVGTTVSLKTKVTMMCGCVINSIPADNPWIPSDFEVCARIKSGTDETTVPLTFDVNSQFLCEFTATKPGEHTAEFFARQKSRENTGVARVKFDIGCAS